MRLVVVGVVLLFLLVACAPDDRICTAPYIPHAKGCCLDKDSDSICDPDQKIPEVTGNVIVPLPAENCDIPENQIIYKYVCPDATVADSPGARRLIEKNTQSPVPTTPSSTPISEKSIDYTGNPVIAIRPICLRDRTAAEVTLKSAESASIEAIGANERPRGIGIMHPGETFVIGFCIDCGNAQLEPGSYIIRALQTADEREIYSNDVTIDTNGEYGKECRSR